MKRNDLDSSSLAPVDPTRRAFVLRLLGLGASATTIAALLQACSQKPAVPPTTTTTTAGAAGDELGEMGTELHIYNWSDYIAEDVIPGFEKEFGVKVTYGTYESNEEMMAKLQVGAGGYDVVVPTGYILTVLAAQNLLSPLSKKHLPNFSNIAPMFVNPGFDPDNQYGVPWQWGTTGIAYRADKVTPAPDSWAVFLDPKYAGKMTQMDDERDVIGSWLKFRGKSLNSTDAGELKGAKADAIASKAHLKAYLSAPVKGQLVAGDVWIAQLWNGDTAQAAAEEKAITYVVPKEGAGIWTDSLVIPKSAPHKRAAHEFLNYILRPEVGASISNFTGYGTPNLQAMPKLKRPVPYPSSAELARLEFQKDLGAANQLWDQLWTEIKAS